MNKERSLRTFLKDKNPVFWSHGEQPRVQMHCSYSGLGAGLDASQKLSTCFNWLIPY